MVSDLKTLKIPFSHLNDNKQKDATVLLCFGSGFFLFVFVFAGNSIYYL